MVTVYVVFTSASQVISGSINVFVVNLYRFTITSAVGLVWAGLSGSVIKVARADWLHFAICISFSYAKTSFYFLATALLPIGTVEGVYTGIFIVFTTLTDFFMKEISKLSLCVAPIAIIGITMLAQPWDQKTQPKIQQIPCISWGSANVSTFDKIVSNGIGNWTNAHLDRADSADISSTVVGYIYVILSTTSATISSISNRKIMQNNTSCSVFFWAGLVQLIVSAICVSSLKITAGEVIYMLPLGLSCIGFIVLYLIATNFHLFLANGVYKHLPVSKMAFAKPVCVVLLYIVQRTLLQKFFASHGNMMEIAGIVLIIISKLLSVVITCLQETNHSSAVNFLQLIFGRRGYFMVFGEVQSK